MYDEVMTYEREQSITLTMLEHALWATYSRSKRFLARNWVLIAWALSYVLILWYIDKYQLANIVAGWK